MEGENAPAHIDDGAAAALPPIYVRTSIVLHNINEFIIPEDKLLIGPKWDDWIEDIEEEMALQKVNDPDDKKRCVTRYGGSSIRKLVKHLPESVNIPPDTPQEDIDNPYLKAKRKLEDYFKPKRNKHHGRYIFNAERQKPNESISSYCARLREKANDCQFRDLDETNDRILEHLLHTIPDTAIIRKAIQRKFTLDELLQEAATKQEVNLEVDEMRELFKVAKIRKVKRPKAKEFKYRAIDGN